MEYRLFTFCLLHFLVLYKELESLNIGVGRADCTGPPVEIVFMGYANIKQRGQGLHLRQFSRAYIIDDNQKRIVFVSVDAAMISHALKFEVLKKLQMKYGHIYGIDNVLISGTHTHGTPGGFMMHLLYDMSTFGFVPETFHALVTGIFVSIVKAHENIQPGQIFYDEEEIIDVNINRSPTSYLNNPKEERARYTYDTDKVMTQLLFISHRDTLIGSINWFAVHPTSMNNTNKLLTSDNMGYASILLEKKLNPNSLTGQGDSVITFASSNLGDVSPNTNGSKCKKSGMPCDLFTSSCPISEGPCFASGPGRNMFESCGIIANKLAGGALAMMNRRGAEIVGSVNYIHQFIDMSNAEVKYFNEQKNESEIINGCLPAMGYSFAAGTTDGPGVMDFTQGTTTDNPLWNAVRNFLAPPTEEDIICHFPKPILLATGRVKFPYSWQPTIVPTQILQIGDVLIAALPGEFTTMSGRRSRNIIKRIAKDLSNESKRVVLSGLANAYSSYVTTPEEYDMQRYEAASTIYGPQTLTIYLSQYANLTRALFQNITLESGPIPSLLENKVISLTPPVFFDSPPIGKRFGDVLKQPKSEYKANDQVQVQFVSGNPRNNLQHQKSFLTIEQQIVDSNWIVTATDADWETIFIWKRTSFVLGHSTLDIYWNIPKDVVTGKYRIRHFGTARHVLGEIVQYVGATQTFSVI